MSGRRLGVEPGEMMMTVMRSRWAAIGAAVAVTLGGGGIGLVNAGIDAGERPVTVTVSPERVLDTRVDLGLTGPFTSRTPRDVQITGSVPVASGGNKTVVPADAIAVLVNVTIVNPASNGFLALRPGGSAGDPSTSTVNFLAAGAIEPNAATVDLAADGTIQVYVLTAAVGGTADVLVDIVGYTVDHTHDDRYYTESEVDALLAGVSGSPGPEGPAGPPGPPGSDYENVIVVAKSGGDFTSVTAAMNAIGVDLDYPAASASNRYLVWVAPGVYDDEDIDMQPFVDIEGSGQGVTTVRSTGGAGGISADAATLVGADDAELRNITVAIEAAGAGEWTHAIYTTAATTLRNVTAVATGGAHPRGVMVASGGAPLLIDVVARAIGGTATNTAVDVFLSTMFADGVYAEASGGTNAWGIFVNTASSEVLLENVTAVASGASNELVGVRSNESSITVEGLRAVVNGAVTSNATAVWCNDENRTMRIVGAPTIYAESTGGGSARGVFAVDCNLEVRDAVVDAVSNSGGARSIQHIQNDVAQTADVTIADVEARAESAASNAIGLNLAGSGIGTFGRVTDVNIRAFGGSQSLSTAGIIHSAAGEVGYRGLSISAGGEAGFLYGISTTGPGSPQFDDVVIDATGIAEATVFGVEVATSSTTLADARIRAVNLDSGSSHDAVGFKSNGASDVSFTDISAYAEAETNAWGMDLVASTTRVVRADARAVSTDLAAGVAMGVRCFGGSAEIIDTSGHAASATSASYGMLSSGCDSTVTGSDLTSAGGGANFGLFAESLSSGHSTLVRSSVLAGSSYTVYSSGAGVADVQVVHSTLDGGAASENGSSTQECTGVTYNSGGSNFEAGPVSPCP